MNFGSIYMLIIKMPRTVDGSTQAGELSGGAAGQVPYQSAANTTDFTGPGTTGQVLTSTGGSAPTFQTLPPSNNLPGGTAGQVVYQSAPSTTTFTGPGTSGQVLTSTGGSAPTFQTLSSVPSATTATNLASGTAGQVPFQSSSGVTSFTGPGTSGQVLTSGGVAGPTYTTISTVPSANNITGGSAGLVLYQSASGVTSGAGPGTAGQVLTSNGATAPTFQTPSTTASNIAGGTTGQVVYQSAAGTTSFVGPGTSGQVLTSNGVGAPSYQAIPAASSATNLAGGTAFNVPYQSAVGTTAFTSTTGVTGLVLQTRAGAAPVFTNTLTVFQTFAAGTSGTYTTPTDCRFSIVEMCGGGGGGGANTSLTKCGGGGGGSTYWKLRVTPGTYSYSVGSGGAGATTNGSVSNNGSAGGNTTFGSATSGGGGGGQGGTTVNGGAAGTGNTSGSFTVILSISGSVGSGGDQNTLDGKTSPGGASFWGNPEGAYDSSQISGGSIQLNANGYGVGGTGGNFSFTSGQAQNGAPGRIVITEYY
jgi:collagen type VII alpha